MTQEKPMIYVCIPTTKERRPRLAKLLETLRESNYPNTTLVIHEGVHPGFVEAVHTLLQGINGLVFILSDDNGVRPDTISKLYECYKNNFPNNDGLVAGNDTIQAGNLPVAPFCHSEILKKYLYKGYTHNFSDNELKDIMVSKGKYVICSEAIIDHWHVVNDRTLQDETYASNQRSYQADGQLYLQRKQNGFNPKN